MRFLRLQCLVNIYKSVTGKKSSNGPDLKKLPLIYESGPPACTAAKYPSYDWHTNSHVIRRIHDSRPLFHAKIGKIRKRRGI